jgi:hypothetical protein
LKDVRDFWNATYGIVEHILAREENWVFKNSDQHYLHMLWNLQEEARLGLANGTMTPNPNHKRVEFGVTVDGEADVFQESLYHEYVTWIRFNGSTKEWTGDGANRVEAAKGRLDRLTLTSDIAAAPGPFSSDALTTLLDGRGWGEVMLGTNVLTGTIFPLFHITPLKHLREIWWQRMWFHPYGEALLQAARRKWLRGMQKDNRYEEVVAVVDGVEYIAVDGANNDFFALAASRHEDNKKGGVWNDLGQYLTWDDICGEHEEKVFLK